MIVCVFAAANGNQNTSLAVINPNNETYCLTYANLAAGHKLTFAKCDNSSYLAHQHQWITKQLEADEDGPWSACLVDNSDLCDSINEDGEGVLAAANATDKKQQWSYNWETNQFHNGGEPASKCSQVVLDGNDHKTPIGTRFEVCNTTSPLQQWYFPGYNLPPAAV